VVEIYQYQPLLLITLPHPVKNQAPIDDAAQESFINERLPSTLTKIDHGL